MTSQEAKRIADVNFNNRIQDILNNIKNSANAGNYKYVAFLTDEDRNKLLKLGYSVDLVDHYCSVFCNCQGKYDNKYIISWD